MLPSPQSLWGGKFYKGVKAALLGVNQLVQQRTVGIVEMTESKTKGAAGALLPRQLFTLHKMKNSDQGTGNVWVDRCVGRFKNNR